MKNKIKKYIVFSILLLLIASIKGKDSDQMVQKKISKQKIKPKKLSPLKIPIKTKIISGRHEIPICSSLPLKGEIAILGKQIRDGMSLFFNKIKQEQTKLPFFFNLETRSDNGNVRKLRKNIKKLQKKSPIFLSLLGTDAIAALHKVIEKQSICILFPIDGAQSHRIAENKNVVFFRANYEKEIDALVSYAINELNKKTFAIFYESSEWGQEALKAFKKVLKKYNLKPIASGSYQKQTLNIKKAANKISDTEPDAILCIANARPAYNFIQKIFNKGLHKTAILGLSSLIPIQQTLKKSRGLEIVTSSVVPDPKRSSLPIVTEYRKDMKKYLPNKNLSPISLEGYINAALLSECIKLVKFPITPQKILNVIENLKNVSFKGLPINFDTQSQTLHHNVWINTGEEEKEWILLNTK